MALDYPPPHPSATDLGYRLILAWEPQTLDEWQSVEGNAGRWNEEKNQSLPSVRSSSTLQAKSLQKKTQKAGNFTKKS